MGRPPGGPPPSSLQPPPPPAASPLLALEMVGGWRAESGAGGEGQEGGGRAGCHPWGTVLGCHRPVPAPKAKQHPAEPPKSEEQPPRGPLPRTARARTAAVKALRLDPAVAKPSPPAEAKLLPPPPPPTLALAQSSPSPLPSPPQTPVLLLGSSVCLIAK